MWSISVPLTMTKLFGSTKIRIPFDSKILSCGVGLATTVKGMYVNPEQPPALTASRMPASGLFGWFLSSILLRRFAATSVTVTMLFGIERLAAAAS